MPLGKCFGPAAQQRSLKDGRWSGKSDPNLPSPRQLPNFTWGIISWMKLTFLEKKTNLFQTGRASMRAEIQILNQNCPNDHVWRWCDDMKGRNAFQVLCTRITFASEKRSLMTHLLREMWKHHLHVSDLCSLVFFLNLWNEKLLRDQRNSVNVTLMRVLHPLVSNLSIVKK